MSDRFADLDIEPTLSVAELSALVKGALAKQFPDEVWVRGEVQRCTRSARGHMYFNLVEQQGGKVAASLKAACFANALRYIERTLAEVPGLELADDVEVRVRGRLDYYGPSGSLQMVVTGIDPYFTAGKLAARRAQVLAALKKDGLLDLQRQFVLPAVPLRVGLVTSIGTAAYEDFMHELASSGLGFHVMVADARVQGAEAPASIVAGVRALERGPVDVIAVVRGGGARHDLAAFDDEKVARTIARAALPVFVGVGHQIDRSVADEVAYASFKTPTATAQALVETVETFRARIHDAWAGVADAAVARLDADREFVDHAAQRVVDCTRMHVLRASERIDHLGRAVQRDALRVAVRADERMLRIRERVIERALRRCEMQRFAIDHRAERLRLLDPVNVLARGYSITVGDDGNALRSVVGIAPGALVHTRLADGTVRSRVETVEPTKPEEQ
ncbi:MAG: exodeoxyribonuclease VII large subunit [Acidimicrobiia bacterium]